MLREGYDVLVPGAHMHKINPETDGSGLIPQTAEELEARLASLASLKAGAIEVDDLELAQHYKNAALVLQQRTELAGGDAAGGVGASAADSTAALLRNRFSGPRL